MKTFWKIWKDYLWKLRELLSQDKGLEAWTQVDYKKVSVIFYVWKGFIPEQSELSKKLIEATFQTNANIIQTDNSTLWKLFPTREFRSICESQSVLEKAAKSFIDQSDGSESNQFWALNNVILSMDIRILCFQGNNSLVSYFKSSSKLCDKDVLSLVGDMILAGIDTSSYSVSFLTYLLSNNPEVQDKLRISIEKGIDESYLYC